MGYTLTLTVTHASDMKHQIIKSNLALVWVKYLDPEISHGIQRWGGVATLEEMPRRATTDLEYYQGEILRVGYMD